MQKAFQHCSRDRCRIDLVDFPAVIDVERLRSFRSDLREKFAQLLAEPQMRSDDCQRFRIEIWHVYCISDRAFEQNGANRLGDLDADAFLRLRR